ncbi:MAG: hypothetical protein ACTH2U_08405 [Brevibacterium sp.]
MDLPDYPPEWWDVSLGITSGYRQGFVDGHASGHRAGFDQGIRIASARDLEFAQIVEQEIRRRELYGEATRDLVRRTLDALRTEQNRQNHPNFYPHRRVA